MLSNGVTSNDYSLAVWQNPAAYPSCRVNDDPALGLGHLRSYSKKRKGEQQLPNKGARSDEPPAVAKSNTHRPFELACFNTLSLESFCNEIWWVRIVWFLGGNYYPQVTPSSLPMNGQNQLR
jgi:hypothetical protein